MVLNMSVCVDFVVCVGVRFWGVFRVDTAAKVGAVIPAGRGAVGVGEMGVVATRKRGAKFHARAREVTVNLGNLCMSRKNTLTPLIRIRTNK